jgi:hypothetical protein
LFITAGLVLALVLAFNLSAIAMMGSGAFLLIYAMVNAGHLRIAGETGANRGIVLIAMLLCIAMFTVLSVNMFKESLSSFVAMFALLVLSFTGELIYRKATGRKLFPPFVTRIDARDKKDVRE